MNSLSSPGQHNMVATQLAANSSAACFLLTLHSTRPKQARRNGARCGSWNRYCKIHEIDVGPITGKRRLASKYTRDSLKLKLKLENLSVFKVLRNKWLATKTYAHKNATLSKIRDSVCWNVNVRRKVFGLIETLTFVLVYTLFQYPRWKTQALTGPECRIKSKLL